MTETIKGNFKCNFNSGFVHVYIQSRIWRKLILKKKTYFTADIQISNIKDRIKNEHKTIKKEIP